VTAPQNKSRDFKKYQSERKNCPVTRDLSNTILTFKTQLLITVRKESRDLLNKKVND